MSNEFTSFEQAQEHAATMTERTGCQYMACDAGSGCYPRHTVKTAPVVGDFVSYAFNGDYYPDSKIASISKTMKKITTESGKSYYRRRQTGTWRLNGTWSMVKGHHDKRNPSF